MVSKTHLVNGMYTACGLPLEWVGDTPYDRRRPNGMPIKVTEHIHGVSCARCRVAKVRRAP